MLNVRVAAPRPSMPAIPAIPAGGMPGVMPGMAPMCKTQVLKVLKYDEVSKKNNDAFKKNQPKVNKKTHFALFLRKLMEI